MLLTLLCVGPAGAARLKADATLYARPSATSEVVGQVAAGTRVEVLAESNGWREVKTPTGQGFVRSEQLALGETGDPVQKPTEKKVEKVAPRAEPARDVDRVTAEELQRLTDEVRMLRERPEPATIADLARVEATLTQAIAGSGDRPAAAAAPLPDPSVESMLAVSPLLLLVGGVVGWAASRVMQRRREHRNRIRI